MNSLPVTLEPNALADLESVPAELKPAVQEQLSRIAANYVTCSRPTAFPRPPGVESGLWCRYPDGRASLLEVLFHIDITPKRIVVRRVLLRHLDRLPEWVSNPGDWTDQPAWPIVDI